MNNIVSNTESLVPDLTPAENAYFEKGGDAEIPAGNKAGEGGEGGDNTNKVDATGGGKDGSLDKDGIKVVPLAALHEERGKRKNTDAQNRELEKQIAELRGKFSIIEKMNTSAKEEPAAEITPETDIFGFAKKTGETVAQLQARLDKQDEDRKAEGDRNTVISNYRADAAAFEAKTPDYRAAYNHLLNSRAQELQALGYDDINQLREAVEADELSIAQFAMSKGKSPAEVIYSLAVQRGYVKADGKKAPDAADKLDNIERGQNSNKSLSNTGGGSGDNDMTAAMLLKMPNDEFETWCAKNPAKAKRIFNGG